MFDGDHLLISPLLLVTLSAGGSRPAPRVMTPRRAALTAQAEAAVAFSSDSTRAAASAAALAAALDQAAPPIVTMALPHDGGASMADEVAAAADSASEAGQLRVSLPHHTPFRPRVSRVISPSSPSSQELCPPRLTHGPEPTWSRES